MNDVINKETHSTLQCSRHCTVIISVNIRGHLPNYIAYINLKYFYEDDVFLINSAHTNEKLYT